MKVFGAYLEDYHFIKVIIPKGFGYKSLKLVGNNEEVDLSIFKDETSVLPVSPHSPCPAVLSIRWH